MKIFVCGNPLVPEDSLPLRLIDRLREENKGVEFVEFDPTEDLPEEKELLILDAVINADDIFLIEDIDRFVNKKALSLHDFDLGWNLKLAKKVGKIDRVKIIAVPPGMEEGEAVKKINSIITEILH